MNDESARADINNIGGQVYTIRLSQDDDMFPISILLPLTVVAKICSCALSFPSFRVIAIPQLSMFF